MEQDLAKSLVELIDQTIAEIEELKKSDRFSASEIKLEGPGEGIAGKDPQGKLGKEEDEEEKKKKEEEKKKAEMAKGVLDESDPGRPGDKVKKEEDEEDEEEDEEGEGEELAEKAEKQPATGYEIKKSEEEMNTLMKSMIDDRVRPLESKIDSLIALVKDIADAPAAPKAVSYRDITPLKKSSDEEMQPLSKADVASKLLELKKSGQVVDSLDITQAELGNPVTLQKIVAKYNIK